MDYLRKYTLTSACIILLAGLLQAQAPAAPPPAKPLPGAQTVPASGAAASPGSAVADSSIASPYYPYGCYYYGSSSYYGDLPNAQACSNSNGNQPNGNLQLHNSASMNYNNQTGTFLASSNTGNTASGDAASISSYTSANAYSPANPAPISEVQISGSANSNGQASTGNLNNLDQTNSANTPGGNADHLSDSQINGTGTGVNLYSNAQANGQAYNYMTSTYPPKGAVRNDKKIFFEPNNARARGSARRKAVGTGKQNAANAKSPLARQRPAGQSISHIQKSSLSANINQNRRAQRQ